MAAEYNGCDKLSHIRDKIVEMSFQSALAFGTAIAAGYKAKATASGVYLPDDLLVNAAKLQAVDAVWVASKLACEIAGGVICTVPSQKISIIRKLRSMWISTLKAGLIYRRKTECVLCG